MVHDVLVFLGRESRSKTTLAFGIHITRVFFTSSSLSWWNCGPRSIESFDWKVHSFETVGMYEGKILQQQRQTLTYIASSYLKLPCICSYSSFDQFVITGRRHHFICRHLIHLGLFSFSRCPDRLHILIPPIKTPFSRHSLCLFIFNRDAALSVTMAIMIMIVKKYNCVHGTRV